MKLVNTKEFLDLGLTRVDFYYQEGNVYKIISGDLRNHHDIVNWYPRSYISNINYARLKSDIGKVFYCHLIKPRHY